MFKLYISGNSFKSFSPDWDTQYQWICRMAKIIPISTPLILFVFKIPFFFLFVFANVCVRLDSRSVRIS